MALNITHIQGRLTKDPDLKETKTGKKVCTFTVAVDKRGKDAGVNFLDCAAWEGRGETISKYFKKGSPILITGRLDQQTWEQDGMKRSKIIILVDDFNFLGSKMEESTPSEGADSFDKKPQTEGISYDSIPF